MPKAKSSHKSNQTGTRRFNRLIIVIALVGITVLTALVVGPALSVRRGPHISFTSDQLAAAGARSLGAESAPVLVVEFADFQCGACAQYADRVVNTIKSELVSAGLVRYVFMDYPLERHEHAKLAARAGHCANEQDGFWPVHDRLFASRDEWIPSADPAPIFTRYAEEANLDAARFESCLSSDRYDEQITTSYNLGRSIGVRGTPSIIVDGQLRDDFPTAEQIRKIAVAQQKRMSGS